MTPSHPRLLALRLIVRIALKALAGRPTLKLKFQLAVLDAGREYERLDVMRALCEELGFE